MTGVPWELGCAPRDLNEKGMDFFGAPPPQQRDRERKRAGRGKGKQPATSGGVKSALEPINERPHHQIRQDAATSTTDLAATAERAELQGHSISRQFVHSNFVVMSPSNGRPQRPQNGGLMKRTCDQQREQTKPSLAVARPVSQSRQISG